MPPGLGGPVPAGSPSRTTTTSTARTTKLSWIDWDDARDNDALTRFTAHLVRLRSEHPLFRWRRFFDGRPIGDAGATDVAWLRRDGTAMTKPDWTSHAAQTLTVFLNGHGIPEPDALGEPIIAGSFLVPFNPVLASRRKRFGTGSTARNHGHRA